MVSITWLSFTISRAQVTWWRHNGSSEKLLIYYDKWNDSKTVKCFTEITNKYSEYCSLEHLVFIYISGQMGYRCLYQVYKIKMVKIFIATKIYLIDVLQNFLKWQKYDYDDFWGRILIDFGISKWYWLLINKYWNRWILA